MGGFFRLSNFWFRICFIIALLFCITLSFLVMDSLAAEMVDESLPEDTSAEEISNTVTDRGEEVLISVEESVTRITAQDTSGFKSIILSLIGPYEMLTKDYTYQNSQTSYYSHSISTESDYAWLTSAGIFIIIVYCFLRILGGVICGRD